MIPRVGDKVVINPEFLRRWALCRGQGIPLPAHRHWTAMEELLNNMAILGASALTVRMVLANGSHPEADMVVGFVDISADIWINSTGRYKECLYCCEDGNIPCPFGREGNMALFMAVGPQTMPLGILKSANTAPGAKLCAACGGPLKDPGMGPTYKHCPKCEP